MKLNPEIFRNAALVLEEGKQHFACWAIEDAAREMNVSDLPYLEFFAKLFNPQDGRHVYWTNSEPEGIFGIFTKIGLEVRIFALILAAEICKDS